MNVKKFLSIFLIITIILPMSAVYVSAQTVTVSDDSQNTGINYDVSDVIITGMINGNADQKYYINLTEETITFPSDYKITAYSINDGKTWTSLGSKIFNDDELTKLFSKDFTLVVTDKYDAKTKKPAIGAKTVKFAQINKRPTLKSYSANYLIGADSTGETAGTWVLVEKKGTKSIKENIEIAVADSAGKAPNSKGYGKFYGKDGTSNGIEVAGLPTDGKAASKVYFIRNAASANSDGTYTAASKPDKITVKGQSKPSTYNVNKTKKSISYTANTYIFIEKTELKNLKGTLDISKGGDIYLWSAATDTEPASAMQKTSVKPGSKAVSYTTSTVTELPKTAVFEDDNGNKINKGSYVKGSDKPFTFTVQKNFDTFKNVVVNGETLVKDQDYTVQSGSTVVTLSESFLGRLEYAEYSLSVDFTDGNVTRYFTIDDPEAQNDVLAFSEPASIMPFALSVSSIYINGATTMTVNSPGTYSAMGFDGAGYVSSYVNWEIYDAAPISLDPAAKPSSSSSTSSASLGVPLFNPTVQVNPLAAGAGKKVYLLAWIGNDTDGYIYSNVLEITIVSANPGVDTCIVTFYSIGGTGKSGISAKVGGTPFEGGSLQRGTGIQFTAEPERGYNVQKWTVDGVDQKVTENNVDVGYNVSNTLTWAIPTDTTKTSLVVVVYFIESNKVTFGVAGNGGKISASSEIEQRPSTESEDTIYVSQGRNVTFTAIPDPGYQVKEWQIGVRTSGVGEPTDFIDDQGAQVSQTNNADTPRWTSSTLTRTVVMKEIIVRVVFEAIPPEITTNTLSEGKLEHPTPYNSALAGRSLFGNGKWSLALKPVGEAFPPGLTLNENGTITGTPTAAGTYIFTVKLEDIVNNNTRASITKELKIVILNQVIVTYEINGVQNGTIAAEYSLQDRVFPDQSGKSVTINAWEKDTITFIARPNNGYTVNNTDWNPSGKGTITNNTDYTEYKYTITNITGTAADAGAPDAAPKTFQMEVKFSPRSVYYVYYSVRGGNGITSATLNGAAYSRGAQVSSGSVVITAIPNSGYRVKEWRMLESSSSAIPSDFDTQSAVVGVTDSYTVPPPSTERYIIVTVEFEPLGSTADPQIVQAQPPGDGSAFLRPDATVGIKYAAQFEIEGIEYEFAEWSIVTTALGYTINRDTGLLSGTPASSGRISITVKAIVYSKTNSIIGEPTKTFNLNILAPTPLVISPDMPDGVVGFSYSEFIQYTGSEATAWTEVGNILGSIGLALDPLTGKISGMPTISGTFTFTVKVTNAAGDVTQPISINISDPAGPTDIQPATLPDATVKILYSQTLTANGGRPSVYKWSWVAASGSILPPGLALNSATGEITGTPTTTGKYTFIVSANNSSDAITLSPTTHEYTVTVNALSITPNPPNGTINESYSHKFTLNGNVSSNVTWSWAAAAGFILPSGLALNGATGEITGTPTATGTYRFDITATEKNGGFAEKRQFTITINAFSPPVITTDDVLYGEVGVKFWEVLAVEGNSPIEWEWTDSAGGRGNLPPGLVLSDLDSSDPARTQYGIISGIPTEAGFYNITVSAISCRGTSNESIGTKNIVIIIRGSINVTSITGVPTEATINRQVKIQATVNPGDATYQSIIWRMATMEEIVKDIEKIVPGNVNIWLSELRKLLDKAGILQSSALLDLTDDVAFIRELARRTGVTIPASADMSVFSELLAIVNDIIKKPPPYGDASLNQNNISKTTPGIIWLKATIENGNLDNNGVGDLDFMEYFPIDFKVFVPVLNITGVPTEAVAEVPLALTGTVYPYTATNTAIIWEIKWTDIPGGAKLQNSVLTSANAGNVMITARIRNGASISPPTDYTKDFLIKVTAPSLVLKVIEPQSNTLESGVAGKATYAVETKYIADGIYTVKLTSSPTGITLGSSTKIQIKNGKGTLTVYTTTAVPADTYSLSIELQDVNTTDRRIVAKVESNKFACKVIDRIPPTIIRPSELTDGSFPPKEVGGSMGQLNLPNGSMNVQYNETLLTKGFEYTSKDRNEIIPPTYWRIIGGTLPPGLTLTQWIEGASSTSSANSNSNPSTGSAPSGSTGWDTGYARAGCVIEGKPTAIGVGKLYTFIIETDEIVYFQRGSTVIWQKEGYTEWIKANPSAEKITWTNSGGVNTVVFSGKKAVRTINILVETTIYYPATGVTITPATLKIPLGGTDSLAANVLSTGTGAPHNAASIQNVTWQTSNPRVATVDSYGNIYGVSEGTAIITATTFDKNITATREVTVYNTPVTSVSLNKSKLTLTIGGTGILTATVRPSSATNKAVAFDSSDLNIATVDANGKVTGVGVGTVDITVTTMDVDVSGKPKMDVCKVTVQDVPAVRATKVSINKTATKLTVGESETLVATILPGNASVKTVTWSSGDETTVAVNPVTGEITAVKPTPSDTTVVITATVDQSGAAVTVKCRVTVIAAPAAEKISLNKTVTRLIVGESETLTATVSPVSASKRAVTWSSDQPNSVSVDPVTGKITARAATTTTPVIIKATVDGTTVVAECRVDVDAAPTITNISLNKDVAVVPVGMTEMLTATLTPVHSIEYNRDNLIWRSLDENIATVDSKGNVTGRTVGTTFIEVGTTNGLTAKCAIEVMPLNTVVPTFVDVNSSEWYFPYISQAVAYGLVNGIGNDMFAPERNITRAEFVTMVVRVLNLKSQKNTSINLRDVNPGDWYYDYIKMAMAEGMLDKLISSGDNNFYPNRAIRREEMAVILAAAAKYQGLTSALSPEKTLSTPTNPAIKDRKLITAQYAEDVELVYKLGLMNGYPDGTFDPQGVSTRAQAATVMVRLYHEVARFF